MLDMFPPHMADFYKMVHREQYPPGTEYVYSNFTCRSDAHANKLDDFDHRTVFFGCEALCKWLFIDVWNKNFFARPLAEVVAQFQDRMDTSLGKGAIKTDHIAALHKKGYLPIRIKAVKEGSRVDIRVPMLTIINTDPEFFWLTNYLETQLSAELWKMITTATVSFEYRRLLMRFAHWTGSPIGFVDWQGHDFSMRGMAGCHDATMSGMAHLVSFTGTDTIPAIDAVEKFYNPTGFVGGSVPATEHSVMCMGGEEDELETFRRIIRLYPTGVVSIVSDTWDFWAVMTEMVTRMKSEIMLRDGKVVFRPDSGDPVKILVGDPEAPEGSPEHRGAVECLWDVFGGEITSTNHKLLDSHVGLIYGDSITLARAQAILAGLAAKGFASGNVVFGVGSYTYQYCTRDTYGTAIKATWGVVNGVPRELFKAPKTDNGIKKSAKGLLRVEEEGGHFVLYDQQTVEQEKLGALEVVFEDGKMVREESFDAIRERLLAQVY